MFPSTNSPKKICLLVIRGSSGQETCAWRSSSASTGLSMLLSKSAFACARTHHFRTTCDGRIKLLRLLDRWGSFAAGSGSARRAALSELVAYREVRVNAKGVPWDDGAAAGFDSPW